MCVKKQTIVENWLLLGSAIHVCRRYFIFKQLITFSFFHFLVLLIVRVCIQLPKIISSICRWIWLSGRKIKMNILTIFFLSFSNFIAHMRVCKCAQIAILIHDFFHRSDFFAFRFNGDSNKIYCFHSSEWSKEWI